MKADGFFAYHKALFRLLKSRDKNYLSIKGRLHLYLALLTTTLLGCTFFLLLALDILPTEKNDTASHLSQLLDDYHRDIASTFNNIAGQGILLSQKLSEGIEDELFRREATIAQVSDNPKLIDALEDRSYEILEQALLLADCSGAFVILDATVNTSLPNADFSRAGVYLKLANINKYRPIAPNLLFVRGMHEVGSRHPHIFHNKWELEFSLDRLDAFLTVKKNAVPDLGKCFLFTRRIQLEGTWETMMLLCVPLMDSRGQFLGICGLEINSLYFKLAFPLESTVLPPVTGMLSCRVGDTLDPSHGLKSGAKSGYFADALCDSLKVEEGGRLNRYLSADGNFVGLERPIKLSPLSDHCNAVTVLLIPESMHTLSVQLHYAKVFAFCAIFLALGYFLSYRIGRRFIDPILDKIGSITTGQSDRTEIPEIDDLIVYLSREDSIESPQNHQADMSSYKAFISNIELLSKAERAVFNLYMKGFSAPEIANQLHISINTVKSHNKRIYMKLNVSSRKELLIFAKMMNPSDTDQA